MNGKKVAEVLFAKFGFKEFLTRDIPSDVMGQLTKLMEIHDEGPGRNIKVGQHIGDFEGFVYSLESGQTVKLVVTRPENRRLPRRFQLTDFAQPAPKNAYKISVSKDPETMLSYDVVLVESGESWAVLCPALRGCVSQGETEAEALENIQEAITLWLEGAAIDGERRKQQWLDEYNAAGYPAKTATVSVPRIKADAAIY